MLGLRNYKGKTSFHFPFSYTLIFALFAFICIFLIPVTASSFQVILEWDASSGSVEGYRVFEREFSEGYDFDNPAWEGLGTTCTISGLVEGVTYYFVVRAFNEYGESSNSNEVRLSRIGVTEVETGQYETTGKGKEKNQNFVLTGTFDAGDEVVLHIHIVDTNTGLPVVEAIAEIAINDSENTILISEPSNSDGIAEATWNTTASKGKVKTSGGTAPGSYEATVTNVAGNNTMGDRYIWDGNNAWTTFLIE